MKVLLVSDIRSSHTVKWANTLSQRGVDVRVFGLFLNSNSEYLPNIKIDSIDLPNSVNRKKDGNIEKLIYLYALPKLKKIISNYQPDIIHAHYVSSYGLLAALTNFHPFVASVWGNDVFDFPKISFVHKKLFKFVLKRADIILSTSHIMAAETSNYTNKVIEVLPFGIDIKEFIPISKKADNHIAIGAIKSLENHYGLDTLIEAFSIVKSKSGMSKNITLSLIGGGSLEDKLKKLVQSFRLEDSVSITGQVPYSEVLSYHQGFDIEVYLSNKESFGVSILEAMACGNAVIVSDIGGLPELVENLKTGFIVAAKNPYKTAEIILQLIDDPNLRIRIGRNAREKVVSDYNWDANVKRMIAIYNNLLKRE
ncbi:MAG: glycosyltransferase [Ignavibacteriaceae bacterium]